MAAPEEDGHPSVEWPWTVRAVSRAPKEERSVGLRRLGVELLGALQHRDHAVGVDDFGRDLDPAARELVVEHPEVRKWGEAERFFDIRNWSRHVVIDRGREERHQVFENIINCRIACVFGRIDRENRIFWRFKQAIHRQIVTKASVDVMRNRQILKWAQQ